MARRTYSGGVVKRTVLSGGVVERTVLSGGVVERTVLSGGVAPEATGPVLWTPAEILADLAVWYDGTVTLDGFGNIATVVDQSGNGNHGTPVGTGALAPGTWNGFGSVVGAGSSAGIAMPIAVGDAFSMQLSVDRMADAAAVVLNAGATSLSTVYLGAFDGTTSATISSSFVGSSVRLNGDALATQRVQIQNAVSGGGVLGLGWTSVNNFVSYKILQYGGVGFEFSGRWGDLLMLKAAPTLDIRQKIEGYLAWRRGTVAKLPVGHPYKDAPPEV